MRTLFLTIADWDITWVGLGRLRPRKEERFPLSSVLLVTAVTSWFLLPLLPVLYWMARATEADDLAWRIALGGTAFGLALNFALQGLTAVYWNQRADGLRGG